jgi:hypothetical protein
MRAQAVRAFARPGAVSGIDLPGLRSAIRNIGLPSWFLAVDLLFQFLDGHLLLTDSRLYQ